MGMLLAICEPEKQAVYLPGNRSLLFDKGLRWGSRTWTLGAGDKETFLKGFSSAFREDGADHFASFLKRREAALLSLCVQPVPFIAQTRLVVGLGLPSPLETGFLLDRLTGCPYLPGSSVKGLLRAAARLVQKGELEGEKIFWDVHLERIFGPEITPGAIPKTGETTFYDAFPSRWPSLEVDVLTPHYGKYYRDAVVPGDWDNPVPVPFLAVMAGTTFHFYIQAAPSDFESLKKLLGIALDWLGIGAKKSSGYGVFGKEAPAAPTQPHAEPVPSKAPRPAQPPPRPPRPAAAEIAWDNVELRLLQGSITAHKGRQTAACERSEVDREIVKALVRRQELRAEVDVLKLSSGEYRLVRVKSWRRPS
jgi:CRISPR-associated protein Cmr6